MTRLVILLLLLACAASDSASRMHGTRLSCGEPPPPGEGTAPAMASSRPAPGPLHVVADVPLPGPPVRFDYQSLDTVSGRLYLAHMGAGELVVVDTKTNQVVGVVSGLPGVTGVWAVPELGRVYASATGLHRVAIIDSRTLRIVTRVGPIGFPDGITYVPSVKKVFVSDESGGGELVIDATRDSATGTIPLGGEAVLARLAVREQRVGNGRRGLARRRDDGDLVDLVEALQTGARARAAVTADVERVATAAGVHRSSSLLVLLVALRRLHFLRRLGSPDVDDEAARAAVVEEAVDRVREMLAAVLEVAERLHELRPVRDEDGLVRRALGRLTEETDGVRTDGLDGLGTAIDFFDVDAR